MQFLEEVKRTIRSSGAPITVFIIGAAAAVYLIDWFSQGSLLGVRFSFWPFLFPANFYTVLTYPFVGNGFVSLLLMGLWLWSIASIVERDLGSPRYLIFWLLLTALGAFFHLLGGWLTGNQIPLRGLWIPLSAVTVAWGTRYASTPLLFMFAFPMSGKWLAWLAAAFVFFGNPSPISGFFSLLPLGCAYLYAADKIPLLSWSQYRMHRVYSGSQQGVKETFLKWRKEKRDEQRLKDFFERSFKTKK